MSDRVQQELQVFARYLVGKDPGAIALSYYRSWHEEQGDEEARRAPRIDRALVRIARVHPVAARLCDAYAARFGRATLLRRKLVLVLALVECSPTTWTRVESPGPGGRVGGYVRLLAGAVGELVAVVVAGVFLLPLHGVLALLPAPCEADETAA